MGRLPKHYVLVSSTAAGAAILQSLLVAIVSIVLIIQYSSCADTTATLTADEYFMRVMKVQYFQGIDCLTSIEPYEGLVSASQVYIWLIITTLFSLIWLIVSIGMIIGTDEEADNYFPTLSYTWSATTAAVTVVHLALGILFAIDSAKLNSDLANYPAGDEMSYRVDLLRIGALLLTTLAFKGYVLIIVNIVFIITLIMLANGARKILETSQHSMHSRGPLNAFEAQKISSSPWQTQQSFDSTLERRSQQNRGYTDTEDISIPSLRNHLQTDFPSRGAFDRSDSWHQTSVPEYESTRTFSYSEEPRSPRILPPSTAASRPSPTVVAPWRRDPWEQPPPVPAPDYSPVGGRRLKSALKH